MMESDPFDCFGSDDGTDTEDPEESNIIDSHENIDHVRDPSCGVCSQLHAEKTLLMHVKNELMKRIPKNEDVEDDIISKCNYVQGIIDDFCNKRAWMMHIGPEKGFIIQDALKKKINEYCNIISQTKRVQENEMATRFTFTVCELGTYCGYGSIFLAKTLYEESKKHSNIDFHVFTVDINPVFTKVAKELIEICNLHDFITILENELMIDGTVGDNIGSLLKTGIAHHYSLSEDDIPKIDFLLIDHDKDSYLCDLQTLEKSGMIQEGTVVAADNVLFAKIDNYVSYMKQQHNDGIVSTVTMESVVEYSGADILNSNEGKEIFKDGIGMNFIHYDIYYY